MNFIEKINKAATRIGIYIKETDCEYSQYLSKTANCNAFLKLENTQSTGSFKIRGASNKILSIDKDELQRGLITASSGNHGAAFAHMVDQLKLKGIIFLPENVSHAKLEYLKLFDVELKFAGNDTIDAENAALESVEKENKIYVSPYNDPEVIAGQGTIGLEISRQIKNPEIVFVPVGGGGLVSGIAGFLKSVNPDIRIIGCQPENSKVMFESMKKGKILDIKSEFTLADGTAGGIVNDSITLKYCMDFIDEMMLITEEEIMEAIRLILEKHYMLIEGASALSVAAFLKMSSSLNQKNVVMIITGKKISLENLKNVLCE